MGKRMAEGVSIFKCTGGVGMSIATATRPHFVHVADLLLSDSRSRLKAMKSAAVGLVLLDSTLKVIYSNSEVLAVFTYANELSKGQTPNEKLSKIIRSIIEQQPPSESLPASTVFISGRRRYVCRSFLLELNSEGPSKPSIAMTVERDRWALHDLAARFKLTDREQEAVEHLANGPTSKEIAQRMRISPNTVKTFLRFVMIKMGVTTRSGVIGKIIEAGR